jgi:hypothetical protein
MVLPAVRLCINMLADCAKKPIAENLSMKGCKKKQSDDKMRSVYTHLPFILVFFHP